MILLLFLYHLLDSWPSLLSKLRQHEESDKEFVYFIFHPYRSHSQFPFLRRPSCFRSSFLCLWLRLWIRVCFLCFTIYIDIRKSLVHFVLLSCLFQQRLWYFSEKRDASVWVMAFHGRKILSFKSFSVFFERKIKSLTLVFSILSFLHCVKKNNISCYTAFNIKWRKTVPIILCFFTISVAFLKTQKSDFAHLQYLFFDFLTEVCFKIGRTKDARDKLM